MGGKQQKTMFHLFDPVYSSNMSAEREEVQNTGRGWTRWWRWRRRGGGPADGNLSSYLSNVCPKWVWSYCWYQKWKCLIKFPNVGNDGNTEVRQRFCRTNAWWQNINNSWDRLRVGLDQLGHSDDQEILTWSRFCVLNCTNTEVMRKCSLSYPRHEFYNASRYACSF